MKPTVIPAILAPDAKEAKRKFDLIQPFTHWVQIDILDGTLYPFKSWHDVKASNTWKIKPKIELDLMVADPKRVIEAWRSNKNLRRVIWHIEAPIDHAKLINQCRQWKLEAGLSIAPGTPLARIQPFLKIIDEVLVLGVHPGKSGQPLLPSAKRTVEALRTLMPKLPIGFDGGIAPKNIASLQKAGVSRFCVTSAIFKTGNPAKNLQALRSVLS